MVNHRRFFSSVALPIAPQFRLDASCSAADAMDPHDAWTTTTRWGQTAPMTDRALGRLGDGLRRQFDLAAGFLDRGDRRRRSARDLHFDLGLELALAKEPHAVRR